MRRRSRRHAGTLPGLVVARQAARAPSSLSPAVVVTVGVALVIFSGQVLALSVRNQELKATAVAGAATVLDVAAPRGADLIAAVDRADPSGRQAMAVRERSIPGATGVGRVVAVDTSRLGAVAAWSPSWAGVADLAGVLRPPTGDPVELRGQRVDVRLDSVRVRPGTQLDTTTPPADPTLRITLDTGTRWTTIATDPVKDRGRLTAAIPCSSGCRLVGIALGSGGLQPYTASLRITGLGTDVAPPQGTATWLTEEGRWHARVGSYYQPDVQAYATPTPGPGGLTIDFTDANGGSAPGVAPSDVLDPLPVLVGPSTEVRPFAGLGDATAYGTGLDGNAQLVDVVGRAQVLPRALADGVLTDLRTAQDLVDPQADSSRAEVWLAPGAPASVEESLATDGYVVRGREQLSDTTTTLLREPQTRGAAVAQTVTRAAALLTLLALVAARVADAARRRLDWRSLADAGVDSAMLRRLAAAEIGVPALLGVLLGAAGGVLAVVLSAPRLPLVDLTTPGPPLSLGIDWPLALLTTMASLVAVLLVALAGAVLETRRVAI